MQVLHDVGQTSFASDNYSGVHPRILQAITLANGGHQAAYDYDAYSQAMTHLVNELCGKQVACYTAFNGTGTNVLALSAMLPRAGAVLCASNAHIANDEGNAVEYVAGVRSVLIPSTDGKIYANELADYLSDSEHNPNIGAVYVSQVTELGTCYSLAELKSLADECHKHGLYLYVDGARLANAIAHLGCTLADFVATGVDMFSLGGTKNGLMMGELLVIANPILDKKIKHLRKIHLQLGSKTRFISAQFVEWFQDDLWLDLARHSNQMASYLCEKIKDFDGVAVVYEVASNAVFVELPEQVIAPLQAKFPFYVWQKPNTVRLMTSFDTTKTQIDEFVMALELLLETS